MKKSILLTTFSIYLLTSCHDDYDGSVKPLLKDKVVEYALHANTDYLASTHDNLKISIYLATGTRSETDWVYKTTWDTLISNVPAKDLMTLDKYTKTIYLNDVDVYSEQVWYARNIEYDNDGAKTFVGKTSFVGSQTMHHKEKVYF